MTPRRSPWLVRKKPNVVSTVCLGGLSQRLRCDSRAAAQTFALRNSGVGPESYANERAGLSSRFSLGNSGGTTCDRSSSARRLVSMPSPGPSSSSYMYPRCRYWRTRIHHPNAAAMSCWRSTRPSTGFRLGGSSPGAPTGNVVTMSSLPLASPRTR
jgi:hypothetical protein